MRPFLVAASLLLLVAACGLELRGTHSGDGLDATASLPRNDGSAFPGDAASNGDEGLPRPACTMLTTPGFANQSLWQLRSNATFQMLGAVPVVRLTDDVDFQSGAAYWGTAADMTAAVAFKATVFVRLTNTGGAIADGFALTWARTAPGSGPPQVGGDGSDLGACRGRQDGTGFAVMVDTEGANKGIRLVRVPDCTLVAPATGPLPLPADFAVPNTYSLTVAVKGSDATITFGASTTFTATVENLGSNVFFGTTAGTGFLSNAHVVERLTVEACP